VTARTRAAAKATPDDRRAIEGLAQEWAVPATPETVGALIAYAELLLEWGARINLTGAHTVGELVAEHYPDAFALASRLPDPGLLVDVGSGGGLPALPLATLRPALTIDLCEPIAKKGAFLRTAIRELGLGGRVRLQATRGEALAEATPGRFDVAVSRATFAPVDWLPLGRRLVRPGGRVFALAATDAVPPGLPDRPLFYLGGRRALVEVTVPRETVGGPGPGTTPAG
jgi:16S rRNA (guanine527-N7)-methyltransferase